MKQGRLSMLLVTVSLAASLLVISAPAAQADDLSSCNTARVVTVPVLDAGNYGASNTLCVAHFNADNPGLRRLITTNSLATSTRKTSSGATMASIAITLLTKCVSDSSPNGDPALFVEATRNIYADFPSYPAETRGLATSQTGAFTCTVYGLAYSKLEHTGATATFELTTSTIAGAEASGATQPNDPHDAPIELMPGQDAWFARVWVTSPNLAGVYVTYRADIEATTCQGGDIGGVCPVSGPNLNSGTNLLIYSVFQPITASVQACGTAIKNPVPALTPTITDGMHHRTMLFNNAQTVPANCVGAEGYVVIENVSGAPVSVNVNGGPSGTPPPEAFVRGILTW